MGESPTKSYINACENKCMCNIENSHYTLVVQQLYLSSLKFHENTFWESPFDCVAFSNIYYIKVPIEHIAWFHFTFRIDRYYYMKMISKSFLNFRGIAMILQQHSG